MENSVEEDIAKVNTYIELVLEKDYCNCNELNTILGKHCDGSKNVAYAMQHILSDYKRVLKENGELREKVKQLEEENKTLNERNQYLVKYRAKLEKELYESNENYIPVSLVEEKIEEIQKEYEGTLKTANFKEIEKMNNINFRGITLEGQRSILRELLEKR